MPKNKGRAAKPRTEDEGRDSEVPSGFVRTNDPVLADNDEPVVTRRGLSAHEPEVAWDPNDPLLRKPGIEADRLGAGFDPTALGDETGDDSSPRPDENVADEIGAEVGVNYQDDEELHTADKVAQRDKQRWELNPASSEDFEDRVDPLDI